MWAEETGTEEKCGPLSQGNNIKSVLDLASNYLKSDKGREGRQADQDGQRLVTFDDGSMRSREYFPYVQHGGKVENKRTKRPYKTVLPAAP